ncbi:hypothetical protein Bca52824_083207 [Brassica carinata]|uniref:Uncharacterized protein n=1 Tax=Brassica carinata TaxID=52824 RepID=A0A8X7TV06_BRACI|nr:hypothetical protein Bca52824_083207 [Brassica carinata]
MKLSPAPALEVANVFGHKVSTIASEALERLDMMMMMMICDLPDDLESEILSRVPAKSLSELKDPKFVEKNKKMGKAASASLFLNKHEVYSITGDLRVEPSIEFTGKT